jgi:hypothetical protein
MSELMKSPLVLLKAQSEVRDIFKGQHMHLVIKKGEKFSDANQLVLAVYSLFLKSDLDH